LSSPPPLSFDQLASQLSAQQLYDQKLLHDYLESQQPSFDSAAVAIDADADAAANPFMTVAYDYPNPAIRIQQSTPTPQQTSGFAPAPMLSTALDNWTAYNNNVQGQSQTLQTPVSRSARSSHQRASSSSSVGSSNSQYQTVGSAAAGYPYVAHPESSPSSSAARLDSPHPADQPSRSFSNVATHNLPTPTHTPTQDAFMAANFNTYPHRLRAWTRPWPPTCR
jgi:hypothetical protein